MWPFQKRKQCELDRVLKKAVKWDPFEIQKYAPLYQHLQENAAKAVPGRFGIKLLIIADTHGYLAFDKSRFPAFLDSAGDFDLCILLGDIHPAEMPIILDCIPKENIIALKGNHDPFDLYERFGIRDVSGRCFTYRGVRFAGLEGSFRYKTEPCPSFTQYESLVEADALPEADILLTHDIALCDFTRSPAHAGLIGISHYIYKHGVTWHFHGHIHQSYEKCYGNGTKEKSVYLCEIVEI